VGEPTRSRRTKDRKTPAGAGAGSAADPTLDLGEGNEDQWEGYGAAWDAWWASLSDAERSAFAVWSGDDHEIINRHLRHAGPASSFTRRAIANLDAAMERARVPRDVFGYRGVGNIEAFLGGDPRSMIGATFTDKGFMSTSLRREVAAHFAFQNASPGSSSAILRIRVPRGTRGTYYNKKAAGWMARERELLIHRGARVRITGVRAGGTSRTGSSYDYIIDAELY
jgi:hypothetical protein